MVERGVRRPGASASCEVADALCANSGRERTSAFCTRSAGPSTPSACSTSAPPRSCSCCSATSAGPGGGHPGAARARVHPGLDRHPDALQHPARLPPDAARAAGRHRSTSYVEADTPPTGCWGNAPRYMRQPAEGVVGRRRRRGQRLLLRLPAAHRRRPLHLPAPTLDMRDGKVQGFFVVGENPAVGLGATRGCTGWRWRSSTGWSCATWPEIETRVVLAATRPRSSPASCAPEDIGTEVFLLPAAAHTEKDGTFTNTQRLLQWHHEGGRAQRRLPLGAVVHVPPRPPHPREAGRVERGARPAAARPHLGLPDRGAARRAPAPRRCCARSTASGRTAQPLSSYTELRDDGSTACGCWIYCGCYADGVNQTRAGAAGRSRPGSRPSGAGPGRSTAACSTTAPPPTRTGSPWSERKRYVWWDEAARRWTGDDVPDFKADMAPDYGPPTGARGPRTPCGGAEPFVMQADGRGWLFAPQRPRRRAAPDPLRAARVAGREPALRAAGEPGRAQRLRRRRQPRQRRRASSRTSSRPTG